MFSKESVVQPLNRRDLQSVSHVVYEAFFFRHSIGADCLGWNMVHDFGCPNGGDLVVHQMWSEDETPFSCISENGIQQCAQSNSNGDEVSFSAIFSCSGTTTSQLVGGAYMYSQPTLLCTATDTIFSVTQHVDISLATAASGDGTALQQFSCLAGVYDPNTDSSIGPTCESRVFGQRSTDCVGSLCAPPLSDVYAIQTTPIPFQFIQAGSPNTDRSPVGSLGQSSSPGAIPTIILFLAVVLGIGVGIGVGIWCCCCRKKTHYQDSAMPPTSTNVDGKPPVEDNTYAIPSGRMQGPSTRPFSTTVNLHCGNEDEDCENPAQAEEDMIYDQCGELVEAEVMEDLPMQAEGAAEEVIYDE